MDRAFEVISLKIILPQVRKQSLTDLERFKNRWKNAVKNDDSWTDPFRQPMKQNS